MSKKNSPIGVDDFSKLVDPQNNYFFVDKTLFIKEIFDDKAEVTLITRPRRWGKTLNMSMLEHFFSIEMPRMDNRGMFDNLQIATVDDGYYMQHNRQYPVIFVSFKGVNQDSFEDALEKIKDLMRNLFRRFSDILLNSEKLNIVDKKQFNEYLDPGVSQVVLEDALFVLSDLLSKHYNDKKVYILIDEYDAPLNNAYIYDYVVRMTAFMKNLLTAALKGNNYLKKGVMTGVFRISRDSMLSGLNNLQVFSVFGNRYAPYFGFSEAEVGELFSASGLSGKIEEARGHYNGYQIGGCMLYNPWSIVNCLDSGGVLDVYWINTADDRLLKMIFLDASEQIKAQLQQFLLEPQKTLHAPISDAARFDNLKDDETMFWSLLLATGYLTARCKDKCDLYYQCDLRIPNQEVRTLYLHVFREWLQQQLGEPVYVEFLEDLVQGRVEAFTGKLERYLLIYGTGHEFRGESHYHTFLLGLFAGLVRYYDMHSNPNTGFGRADLLLVPKQGGDLGIIIELKHEKRQRVSKRLAAKALEQIDSRAYDTFLQRYSGIEKVLKIGMAFANRTAASCYRWEDRQGKPLGRAVRHRSVKD